MSQTSTSLTVLGLEVTFRAGADMERVRQAVELVEERLAEQKLRTRAGQSRDVLLTFLALSLADDLLQFKKKQEKEQARLASLLAKIEKFE